MQARCYYHPHSTHGQSKTKSNQVGEDSQAAGEGLYIQLTPDVWSLYAIESRVSDCKNKSNARTWDSVRFKF